MTRIKDLEAKMASARHHYYNGTAEVSDKTYDAWIDELFALDPKNPAVIGIGAEPVSNWEKYNHASPMGSLNKAQTYDEFVKWAGNYVDAEDEFCILPKLDGLSVSLIYENGVLVKSASRGSGTIGELITANVAKMDGVPLRLPKKITATIRGEILLSKANHTTFFPDYSNTRNAASGISRRYDGDGCDKLTVLVYELTTDDVELYTHEGQLDELTTLGFIVPPYYMRKTASEVKEVMNEYVALLRDKLAFDLDGLVVHNNNLAKCAAAGATNMRPKASIAYKFDSVGKEAHIAAIVCQVGNSGRITPVAVFDPKVSLMGADVEKATLHNFANIETLGVDVGATVIVCRANDVIPFIEEVVESTGTIFETPTNCPACNAPLIENGEYIQCPNTLDCPAQKVGRISNWISNNNILEWGSVLLERLVETGKVNTIVDLYRLSVDDLASIERMGKKSAFNCYQSLWSHNPIPLELLLGSLSIPMIGSASIKLVMDAGIDTLDKMFAASEESFNDVKGLGPRKSQSLYQGLRKNKEMIGLLMKTDIKVQEKVVGSLTNKSLVFTGAMINRRAVLEDMVVRAGGTVKSSVGKTTTHLVIADVNSSSSKAVAAKKLGVKLISEEEFLAMCEG